MKPGGQSAHTVLESRSVSAVPAVYVQLGELEALHALKSLFRPQMVAFVKLQVLLLPAVHPLSSDSRSHTTLPLHVAAMPTRPTSKRHPPAVLALVQPLLSDSSAHEVLPEPEENAQP